MSASLLVKTNDVDGIVGDEFLGGGVTIVVCCVVFIGFGVVGTQLIVHEMP